MAKISWTIDAEHAMGRVPVWVRPLARGKVERLVRDQGRDQVTLTDVQTAEERFRAVIAGKAPAEIQQTLPQENTAAAKLVVVETCHGQLADCPNVLMDVTALNQAIEEWLVRESISERLRGRVTDARVLFHHKFRIAIAGCPNACSRPQIADVGLVGCVVPQADLRDCTGCGLCARACPDGAITLADGKPVFDRSRCGGCTRCRDACPKHCISLSAAGIRILAGGKLGRHPHLAEVVCEVRTPVDAIAFLDRAVTAFAERDDPHQRFADFWRSRPTEGRRALANSRQAATNPSPPSAPER